MEKSKLQEFQTMRANKMVKSKFSQKFLFLLNFHTNFTKSQDMSLQILKSLKVPSTIVNDKIIIPRNIILKFQNSRDKEKILKHPQRKKNKSHANRARNKMVANVSIAREKWRNDFKISGKLNVNLCIQPNYVSQVKRLTLRHFKHVRSQKFTSCTPF